MTNVQDFEDLPVSDQVEAALGRMVELTAMHCSLFNEPVLGLELIRMLKERNYAGLVATATAMTEGLVQDEDPTPNTPNLSLIHI